MKNGMIIEIKNLGVPVEHTSRDNPSGSVIRWSSDPEVSSQAPAHVIIGNAEFQRFMKLAVPEDFINKAAMTIHPVLVTEGSTAISRQEAMDAGASSESWDNVRALMIIIGKNKAAHHAITKEWYGSRDNYFGKAHIIAAAQFAKDNNIDNPIIFTDDDVSKVLNSSTEAHKHLLTMNPALRTAKLMNEVLERSIANLDLDTLHPDRAMHILGEIKQAALAHQEMKSVQNATLNLKSDTILSAVQNIQASQQNTPAPEEEATKKRPSSGMSLH